MAGAQAVLFDLGGVLIDWDPRHLFRQVIPDPQRLDYFLQEVCGNRWNHAIDAGKPFLEAIRERQAELPEYAEAIGIWYERWEEMMTGDLPETVAVLRDLKARDIPLFALTNWYRETFPIARARFGFLDWFRDIVVSGVEGMAKPDPAFFRLAARRCGLVPARTVFVDDVQANVDSARAVGFDAILFTGAGPLCVELETRGLLDPRPGA